MSTSTTPAWSSLLTLMKSSIGTKEQAEQDADSVENIDSSDVLIFSHGHFSRCFIARWCDLPLKTGYHFASDAGGVRLFFPASCGSGGTCRLWTQTGVTRRQI